MNKEKYEKMKLKSLDFCDVFIDASKNETIIKITCGLHPTDCDSLRDNIETFLEHRSDKTRDFIKDFNKNLELMCVS